MAGAGGCGDTVAADPARGRDTGPGGRGAGRVGVPDWAAAIPDDRQAWRGGGLVRAGGGRRGVGRLDRLGLPRYRPDAPGPPVETVRRCWQPGEARWRPA